MKHTRLAAEQFGATADAYLGSAVHAHGADLQRLTGTVSRTNRACALDLGCGAGHACFAMAEGGARVTAYDVSGEMLAVVAAEARRRGLAGVETRQGTADRLPFADATFDLVATRFSAHHWGDVPQALREARRVLKNSGTLIVIDPVASESALFDTLLQTVEILRDASHVRNYRISEWHAMLGSAGFAKPVSDTWTLVMEFDTWVKRMRTPELRVHAIRDVFDRAPDEAKQHFHVQPDGSFDLTIGWLETTPRSGAA